MSVTTSLPLPRMFVRLARAPPVTAVSTCACSGSGTGSASGSSQPLETPPSEDGRLPPSRAARSALGVLVEDDGVDAAEVEALCCPDEVEDDAEDEEEENWVVSVMA